MFPNKNCNYNEFFEYITELIKINKIEGEEHVFQKKILLSIFYRLQKFLENYSMHWIAISSFLIDPFLFYFRNGILDLAELVTGLSLICGGSQVN